MSENEDYFFYDSDEADFDFDIGPNQYNARSSKPSKSVNFVNGGTIGSKNQEEKHEDDTEALPKEDSCKSPTNEINSFSGLRSSNSKEATGETGDWASDKVKDMMKKMGWKSGKGLGQKEQGIVEPIQAVVHPGRASVGSYSNDSKGVKEERKVQFRKNSKPSVSQLRKVVAEEEYVDEASSLDDGFGLHDDYYEDVEDSRSNPWKKTQSEKSKSLYSQLNKIVRGDNRSRGNNKPKGGNRSKGGKNIVPPPSIKFIDMTLPSPKVYDDFHSFQKMTDSEQQERHNFNPPTATEQRNYSIISYEDENESDPPQVKKWQDKEWAPYAEENTEKVEDITDLVERFNNPESYGLNNLDEYRELFHRIKTEHFTDFVTLGLDYLVDLRVLPLMEQFFTTWDPLNPQTINYGYAQLQSWRSLLDESDDDIFGNRREMDEDKIYDSLVWKAWMPIFQRAATRWDPKTELAQMAELIATWTPILPRSARNSIIDNVIPKRLSDRLEEWDPIEDEIPVEDWIIPWREILGDRLSDVYVQIRQKLAKGLRKWEPTDSSVIAVLKPWKDIFSNSTMQSFLNMQIVPKLEGALKKMSLDQNSKYEEFYAILEWRGLLSSERICTVLVRSFFSKWYENLCNWLELPGSIEDISRYYLEWKKQIPAEFLQMKPIQAEFVRALMAIKQTRDGVPIIRMPNFEDSQMGFLG